MNKKERIEQAERDYPGIAVNNADHAKDNKGLQKERTHILNNNPRNNENEMP
ncbi:MAG: hypothetical protein K2I57_10510 [Muribaculaceae bacterium]|nr:hypothetical protein [Muribaculaceae bacterium]